MVTSGLPEDGEIQLGSVALPAGRRVRNYHGEPVAWATAEPAARPGLVWSALSDILGQTGLVPVLLAGLDRTTHRPWDEGEFDEPADLAGLSELDAADVLAAAWNDSLEEDGEEDPYPQSAQRAPFSRQFPGLAAAEQSRLGKAELQQALDVLPPARVGLVPAARPADALPRLGWIGAGNRYEDALPLAAVLRSWEGRFGARLLEVGFAEIRLLVERPPRDAEAARRIAAEHYAFCDECGGRGLTGISEIGPSLINAPIWAFWWD
jgi:hypothetical protein